MHELRGEGEPGLDEQLARLSPCDLVLVEGYKRSAIPKLEVHRPSHGRPLLHPDDPHIVAVACDGPVDTRLPTIALGDYDAVVRFVLAHLDMPGSDIAHP
jgi:molybdopterin-guanine dinucleotide biosynthesis protein B